MVWCVRNDATILTVEIAACVEHVFGTHLHVNTVYHWLGKYGFHKKRVWVVRNVAA